MLALRLNQSVHFLPLKIRYKSFSPKSYPSTPLQGTYRLCLRVPSPPSLQTFLFHQTALSCFSSSSPSSFSSVPLTTKSKKKLMTPTPDTYLPNTNYQLRYHLVRPQRPQPMIYVVITCRRTRIFVLILIPQVIQISYLRFNECQWEVLVMVAVRCSSRGVKILED